ncbi:hypothetical protein [Marinicella litoralis]|uniref:YfdX protein n=1 Tax=Marinicella litoralis TaxID=644220 RepID=A0A4R6XIS5_9GAMM|nr:hypothetical protein [Marinicella litoralis]TDR19386.1 hypothetical protein C8D91_1935 [Marinicella litoralis]
MQLKLVFLILSLLVLTTSQVAANPDAVTLKEIYELTKDGNFEEALKRHIKFHHQTRNQPSQAGVRLSFALSNWSSLGEQYPPAKSALLEIRDELFSQLQSGKGTAQDFHEISAINDYQYESEKTLDLYLTLDEKFPQQAKQYYPIVEDLLIKEARFDLAGKYMRDPVKQFVFLKSMRDYTLVMAKLETERNTSGLIKDVDKLFNDGIIKIITVLKATDRHEEAQAIKAKADEYLASESGAKD